MIRVDSPASDKLAVAQELQSRMNDSRRLTTNVLRRVQSRTYTNVFAWYVQGNTNQMVWRSNCLGSISKVMVEEWCSNNLIKSNWVVVGQADTETGLLTKLDVDLILDGTNLP
jgi:hypothetical protein